MRLTSPVTFSVCGIICTLWRVAQADRKHFTELGDALDHDLDITFGGLIGETLTPLLRRGNGKSWPVESDADGPLPATSEAEDEDPMARTPPVHAKEDSISHQDTSFLSDMHREERKEESERKSDGFQPDLEDAKTRHDVTFDANSDVVPSRRGTKESAARERSIDAANIQKNMPENNLSASPPIAPAHSALADSATEEKNPVIVVKKEGVGLDDWEEEDRTKEEEDDALQEIIASRKEDRERPYLAEAKKPVGHSPPVPSTSYEAETSAALGDEPSHSLKYLPSGKPKRLVHLAEANFTQAISLSRRWLLILDTLSPRPLDAPTEEQLMDQVTPGFTESMPLAYVHCTAQKRLCSKFYYQDTGRNLVLVFTERFTGTAETSDGNQPLNGLRVRYRQVSPEILTKEQQTLATETDTTSWDFFLERLPPRTSPAEVSNSTLIRGVEATFEDVASSQEVKALNVSSSLEEGATDRSSNPALSSITSLYTSLGTVMMLGEENWSRTTNGSLWVVSFYTEPCQSCQNVAKEITLLSRDPSFPSSVRFGAVNCLVEPNLCEKLKESSLPSILIFLAFQTPERYPWTDHVARKDGQSLSVNTKDLTQWILAVEQRHFVTTAPRKMPTAFALKAQDEVVAMMTNTEAPEAARAESIWSEEELQASKKEPPGMDSSTKMSHDAMGRLKDSALALMYSLNDVWQNSTTLNKRGLQVALGWLEVTSSYFPLAENRRALQRLLELLRLKKQDVWTKNEWTAVLNDWKAQWASATYPPSLFDGIAPYSTCSTYPCAMWTLLHSITANMAHISDASRRSSFCPSAGVAAISQYLSNVFACAECRQGFAARNRRESLREALASSSRAKGSCGMRLALWMWEAHNEVNKKLSRPSWPSSEQCPKCRNTVISKDDSWDLKAVMLSLYSTYSHPNETIHYELPEPLSVIQENTAEDRITMAFIAVISACGLLMLFVVWKVLGTTGNRYWRRSLTGQTEYLHRKAKVAGYTQIPAPVAAPAT